MWTSGKKFVPRRLAGLMPVHIQGSSFPHMRCGIHVSLSRTKVKEYGVFLRHPRENGQLFIQVWALCASGYVNRRRWFFPPWIPAYAGMTSKNKTLRPRHSELEKRASLSAYAGMTGRGAGNAERKQNVGSIRVQPRSSPPRTGVRGLSAPAGGGTASRVFPLPKTPSRPDKSPPTWAGRHQISTGSRRSSAGSP